MSFVHQTYYGNSVLAWATALLIAIGGTVLLVVLRNLVARRLLAFASSTNTRVDDLFAGVVDGTRLVFLFAIALYLGTFVLELPDRMRRGAARGATVARNQQVAIRTQRALTFWISNYVNKKTADDPASVTTIRAASLFVRIALWSVVALLALQNMGVDITALVAGLGVGGIAVALALQNVLSDLFASLSIVLDKPFVQGDFIIVDDYLGTIEYVGMKTTRIRSLTGEQIVFSNTDLLKSRIRNYKSMKERRVVFTLGVTYDTPTDIVAAIPGMLREAAEATKPIRFDRAHLKQFGPNSLDFEVVYYVLDPDYNKYMDIQQAMNLEILRRFESERIEFALPTRIVHVAGTDARAKMLPS
jgi:small-conductance mechanosensitive channel